MHTIEAIYACHGHDAPPTRFPEGAESPTNRDAGINDGGTEVATDAGGGGQRHALSPLLQADKAASRGSSSEGRPEWLDDGDRNSSSSQEARRLFYRREEGVSERNAESTACAAGANGGSSAGGAAHAAGDDSLGSPHADNNNTCSNLRAGRDSAADGGPSGGGGTAVNRTSPPSTTKTGSTSADSSVLTSAATSILMGRAPKLVDFFDLEDEGSRREFQEARDYLEEWREFSIDRAIVTAGLGPTGERLAALDLPLVARYTFQVSTRPHEAHLVRVVLDLALARQSAAGMPN